MDESNFPDLLRLYYNRLFPYVDYYRWLSYGEGLIFARREFSFTLRDDIYIRYQSFKQIEDLKSEIKRLCPYKIDIGAVYNVPPSNRRRELKFEPIQRELVFDIDMTDYDEVRTCCSGADVCNKCWKYMVVAVRILDVALRDDFAFEHILWVFSGRRGIHGWICDKQARFLSVNGRKAIAHYLQLIMGGEFVKKKVKLPKKMHHSVKRAVSIIEPIFVNMCVEEQGMLDTEERENKFLGIILEEDMRKEVKEIFDQHLTGVKKWNAFVDFFKNQIQSGSKKWRRTPFLIEEIMIQYAYPRLDINVTKGMNHLLKSPFCVHPKTGKVCIPINPKVVDQFDVNNVPTIMTLIDEVNAFDAKELNDQGESIDNVKRIKDYKKTSLNKPFHAFQEFLRGLENSQKGEKMIKSDIKMEF
ncbi:DNA primase small subunit [Phymastichus coffea]|uniref:DNA primase small subunit n=1 Tax=Phymastichus coffea TaxID=108790 RepID=UPI00273BA12D|nr:DNA primase small subunit [Phymastichus coffea]XP_058797556.1 DNA primase small subunit [Phymastichus coffea]